MLQLWLENVNRPPALFQSCSTMRIWKRKRLTFRSSIYCTATSTPTKFGPENQNLVDLLRSPVIAMPLSLTGQLQYFKRNEPLARDYLTLARRLDCSEKRETGLRWPGPTQSWVSGAWTPSRHATARRQVDAPAGYGRQKRLRLARPARQEVPALDFPPGSDPDEELGTLQAGDSAAFADRLLERSRASQRFKQIMGNPRRSLGYSLFDYRSLPTWVARRLSKPGQAGLAAWYPASQRHGSQPHGYRF